MLLSYLCVGVCIILTDIVEIKNIYRIRVGLVDSRLEVLGLTPGPL